MAKQITVLFDGLFRVFAAESARREVGNAGAKAAGARWNETRNAGGIGERRTVYQHDVTTHSEPGVSVREFCGVRRGAGIGHQRC